MYTHYLKDHTYTHTHIYIRLNKTTNNLISSANYVDLGSNKLRPSYNQHNFTDYKKKKKNKVKINRREINKRIKKQYYEASCS